MAAIYLPEDQRFSQIGRGIGALGASIIEGIVSSNRQKRIADTLKANPDANVEDLLPLAQGDPKATELINNIFKGRLLKQQQEESKARVAKDAADADRAHAGAMLDISKTLTEQMNLRMEGLKKSLTEAEINEKNAATQGHIAEAAKWRAEGVKLQQEAATMSAMQPIIDNMVSHFSPKAAAPTPNDLTVGGAQPTSQPPQQTPQTSGQSATQPPGQAGYPEGSPDFVTRLDSTVKKLRDWQKSPGGQGMTVGVHAGPVSITQQHDKVTPAEESNQDAILSLAQALGSISDALVKDPKTGQLKLGPVSGRLGQAIAQFSSNPTDANAALGVLTGHADITAGSLLPRTRQGYQLLELLKDILVTPKKGVAFNYNALRNSMRIIVNEAAGMGENQLGRRALGTNPDSLEEIGRIARQTFNVGAKEVTRQKSQGLDSGLPKPIDQMTVDDLGKLDVSKLSDDQLRQLDARYNALKKPQ